MPPTQLVWRQATPNGCMYMSHHIHQVESPQACQLQRLSLTSDATKPDLSCMGKNKMTHPKNMTNMYSKCAQASHGRQQHLCKTCVHTYTPKWNSHRQAEKDKLQAANESTTETLYTTFPNRCFSFLSSIKGVKIGLLKSFDCQISGNATMPAAESKGQPYLAGFGDCTTVSSTSACGMATAAAAFLPLPWPLSLVLLHNRSKQAVSKLCNAACIK